MPGQIQQYSVHTIQRNMYIQNDSLEPALNNQIPIYIVPQPMQ